MESRIAGIGYLPEEYEYVLPLQEDFWLDRAPLTEKLEEAIKILDSDTNVQSIRLMPSPGPLESDEVYNTDWKILSRDNTYIFTFQATLWRIDAYRRFLELILKDAQIDFYKTNLLQTQWSKYCIGVNVAENLKGQDTFSRFCMGKGRVHLSVERQGKHANAVFLAPWPYRPTAVVQGRLEPWAREFAKREGFNLDSWV